MEQATFLKINPADSVVVCLQPKKKGEIIEVDGLQVMINQWLPHRSCQGESEGWRLG